MQRPIDGDVDLRLAVVGELDVVDAADRGAADQDLVALDQLAACLEEQPVVVGVAAAREQQDEDRDRDQDERAECGDARETPPPRTRATCGETAPRQGSQPACPGGPVATTSLRSGPYDGPIFQQLLTCFPAALSPAAICSSARSYLGPQAPSG